VTIATYRHPHPHRLRNVLTAIVALAAALLLAVVVFDTAPTALDGGTTTAVTGQSQRAIDADAARLTALAERYRLEQAIAADGARWTAQAEFYAEHGLLTGPDGLTRGQRADAARWEAQADAYLGR
jgi:hypothetical protein